MEIFDFDPKNLPRDLLAAIGQAITSGVHTQLAVDMAIAACLHVDFEYAGAVLTHVTVPNKLSILRSVAIIAIDDLDQLDELDEIVDRIEEVLKYRNDLAHHKICRSTTSNETFMIKETSRTSYSMERYVLKVPEVEQAAVIIHQAGLRLVKFLMDNGLFAPKPPHGRSHIHKTKAARKKRRKKT